MDYKEYRISTYWSHADLGFRYEIYDAEGKTIIRSDGAYCYEENAQKDAKKEIDQLC